MDNCLFCKIVRKEIPSLLVYEDEQIVVFPDIHAKANLHLLVVPKIHIEELLGAPEMTVKAIFEEISRLVKENSLETKGYRIVVNGGAAKAVPHLHVHLLGDVEKERQV